MTASNLKNGLSSGERKRQLEESVTRAMDHYKSEFEAVRDRTARLRAAREAAEAAITPPAPPARKAVTSARRKAVKGA